MPRTASIFTAVAGLCVAALGAHALVLDSDEPLRRELSQPWKLGEADDLSVALDARGDSSLAWSAERPLGIESRHELVDGVSLHVGGEALIGDLPGETAPRLPDWQAGAAVRAKLDDRWTAGVGAGWRSTTSGGLSAALDSDRRSGSLDGEGEGVVWFRLSASF
jgi:hypothetical protein